MPALMLTCIGTLALGGLAAPADAADQSVAVATTSMNQAVQRYVDLLELGYLRPTALESTLAAGPLLAAERTLAQSRTSLIERTLVADGARVTAAQVTAGRVSFTRRGDGTAVVRAVLTTTVTAGADSTGDTVPASWSDPHTFLIAPMVESGVPEYVVVSDSIGSTPTEATRGSTTPAGGRVPHGFRNR